jgi:ATP-dependent DNA ligase
LEVDGTDLRREPIEVRKATLASLLRLASRYVSGRSKDWIKFKNPEAPDVKREAEVAWGRDRWR